MDTLLIFFARDLIFIIVAITFLATWRMKQFERKKLLTVAVIALPFAYIAAKIAGQFYFDPRPFVTEHFIPRIAHAADNGFPSDHALLSFTLASLVFTANKRVAAALFLLGLLVSAGRVAVGLHRVPDIVGSMFISITVVFLASVAAPRFSRRSIT